MSCSQICSWVCGLMCVCFLCLSEDVQKGAAMLARSVAVSRGARGHAQFTWLAEPGRTFSSGLPKQQLQNSFVLGDNLVF